METGTWRVARGWKELVLLSDDGQEQVVEVASGEPPTGGGLDLTLGQNSSRYEKDDDGAIRCLYFDGTTVLWSRGPDVPAAGTETPVSDFLAEMDLTSDSCTDCAQEAPDEPQEA